MFDWTCIFRTRLAILKTAVSRFNGSGTTVSHIFAGFARLYVDLDTVKSAPTGTPFVPNSCPQLERCLLAGGDIWNAFNQRPEFCQGLGQLYMSWVRDQVLGILHPRTWTLLGPACQLASQAISEGFHQSQPTPTNCCFLGEPPLTNGVAPAALAAWLYIRGLVPPSNVPWQGQVHLCLQIQSYRTWSVQEWCS